MPDKLEDAELAKRFASLIDAHAAFRTKDETRLQTVINKLLPVFIHARKNWAEAQRKTADDFNLFEVLGVAADEVRHSKILAWLLDHRIERGSHAQGNLGFRLFLEEFCTEFFGNDATQVGKYADETNYWVHCEVKGEEARVDIRISARGRFLIDIENKIHSWEGEDQTGREWRDLQAQRIELSVPLVACHALFLTLDASPATNENFRAIGWNRIAKVLDRFADLAEPVDVKLFARHYAKAIRMMRVIEQNEQEVDNAAI
jgi:hypothetical protein